MLSATYFFFGGLLMIIGAVFEFLLGNTFPFVVFGSFGMFLYLMQKYA
jgi:succinate-acetate transporter protein